MYTEQRSQDNSVSIMIRLLANQEGLGDSLPAGQKIVLFLQFPTSRLPTQSVRWCLPPGIKRLCLVIQHGLPSGTRLRLYTPLRIQGAILN